RIVVSFLAPKVRNKIDSGFNRWCQNVKKYSPCKGETMNCAAPSGQNMCVTPTRGFAALHPGLFCCAPLGRRFDFSSYKKVYQLCFLKYPGMVTATYLGYFLLDRS
ncbi:MAG: hypothetical protein ACRC10_09465, partial [Thermoguttaceae bacterium]